MNESTVLDGNVLAGALGELFAVDVTAATGRAWLDLRGITCLQLTIPGP